MAATQFVTKAGYSRIYVSLNCAGYHFSRMSTLMSRIQRKSRDGDTRDTARARKHPWSKRPNILILPPNTVLQLSPLYNSFPRNKRSSPSNRVASFGHFYYTVGGINFEQQKEPPLPNHHHPACVSPLRQS